MIYIQSKQYKAITVTEEVLVLGGYLTNGLTILNIRWSSEELSLMCFVLLLYEIFVTSIKYHLNLST